VIAIKRSRMNSLIHISSNPWKLQLRVNYLFTTSSLLPTLVTVRRRKEKDKAVLITLTIRKVNSTKGKA
jgi:hypothetical protein